MKHILTVILITVFLSPLLPAQTDTVPTEPEDPGVSGTWEVVAGGGMSVPFEPEHYDDAFKNGYYFGGGLAYSLPTGDLGYGEISLMVQYYNTPFDDATFIEGNGLDSAANVYGYPGDVFTAMAQFRGVFAGSKETIAPFFTMGVGMFHIAVPEMGVFGSAERMSSVGSPSRFSSQRHQ